MPEPADLVEEWYQGPETGTPNSSNSTSSTVSPYFWDESLTLHPHWQQQRYSLEAIPDTVHYLVGVYIGVIGLGGTLANGVVIYLFIT